MLREVQMPFKRIICAIDFSEGSPRVFEAAMDVAHRDNAEVLVLHLIEVQTRISYMPPDDGMLSEATLEMENAAREALEGLIGESGRSIGNLRLTTEIDDDIPSQGIMQRVKAWEADLIVVGSRGTAAGKDPLGSTARQVLADAPCSVLVVRTPGWVRE
jgi:nucleotide-binding universal stress UspA family protein